MIGLFIVFVIYGGFMFMAFGLSAANSDESEKSNEFMAILSIIGAVTFLIGLIGIWVVY